ncbi:MAG: hypothetical protein ABI629_03615, partial [bacterium]
QRVPVVPVVSHGGHDTTLILTRGEWIGRWLGLGRIRTRSFPLALQVPWGLSPVGLPSLPLPAKITMRVLPPMDWSALPRRAADDPDVVRRCYAEITERMQATLTSLAVARPYPVLSRLASLVPFAAPRPPRPLVPRPAAPRSKRRAPPRPRSRRAARRQ